MGTGFKLDEGRTTRKESCECLDGKDPQNMGMDALRSAKTDCERRQREGLCDATKCEVSEILQEAFVTEAQMQS